MDCPFDWLRILSTKSAPSHLPLLGATQTQLYSARLDSTRLGSPFRDATHAKLSALPLPPAQCHAPCLFALVCALSRRRRRRRRRWWDRIWDRCRFCCTSSTLTANRRSRSRLYATHHSRQRRVGWWGQC